MGSSPDNVGDSTIAYHLSSCRPFTGNSHLVTALKDQQGIGSAESLPVPE